MKLTNNTQNLLTSALEIANTMGMDALILDKTSLRSHNKQDGIALIMPTKNMDLEFDSIAVGRVDVLLQRLKTFKDCHIEYDLMQNQTEDQKVVANVKIVSGKTKLGYKCHDPARLSIIKGINDADAYEITFNSFDVKAIVNGINAMKSDFIHLGSDDDTVNVKISDSQGDFFSHEMPRAIESLTDSNQSLTKTYKCKLISKILNKCIEKNLDKIDIKITKRGIMIVPSNNMNIYVFPER